MGTHLSVLSESYPINTNMIGFRWVSLLPHALDKSSPSIGRVKMNRYWIVDAGPWLQIYPSVSVSNIFARSTILPRQSSRGPCRHHGRKFSSSCLAPLQQINGSHTLPVGRWSPAKNWCGSVEYLSNYDGVPLDSMFNLSMLKQDAISLLYNPFQALT